MTIDAYNPWHWVALLAVVWLAMFGGLFMTLGQPFPADHGQFATFWCKVYATEWLVASIVLVCVWRSGAGATSIGLVRPHLRATVWLAIVLMVLAIAVVVTPEGPVKFSGVTRAEQEIFPWSHGERLFLLFAACLTAPFCEEVMYRGFLLAFLRPIVGLRSAIWLQALLFGYQHFVVGGWRRGGPLFALVFGLLIARLAVRRGNLRAAMAVHFVFDAVALTGGILA